MKVAKSLRRISITQFMPDVKGNEEAEKGSRGTQKWGDREAKWKCRKWPKSTRSMTRVEIWDKRKEEREETVKSTEATTDAEKGLRRVVYCSSGEELRERQRGLRAAELTRTGQDSGGDFRIWSPSANRWWVHCFIPSLRYRKLTAPSDEVLQWKKLRMWVGVVIESNVFINRWLTLVYSRVKTISHSVTSSRTHVFITTKKDSGGRMFVVYMTASPVIVSKGHEALRMALLTWVLKMWHRRNSCRSDSNIADLITWFSDTNFSLSTSNVQQQKRNVEDKTSSIGKIIDVVFCIT